MESKINIFSRDTLKVIAAVTMLIDHFAYIFVNSAEHTQLYRCLRGIGRLSFPIFCFVLVQGFQTTKDVRKYLIRLFLFALLSEIPYDFAFSGQLYAPADQNVIFTMFIGVLVLAGMRQWSNLYVQAAVLLAGCLAAAYIRSDYTYQGVALIAVFYLLRDYPWRQMLWAAIVLCMNWGLEVYAVFALPLCRCYAPEKGKQRLPRYFFYIFYPGHLLVLGTISYLSVHVH